MFKMCYKAFTKKQKPITTFFVNWLYPNKIKSLKNDR